MRILEEIDNMRNQGMTDREISGALQDKGLTPRVIDDAFNRLKIKSAINTEEGETLQAPSPIPKGGMSMEGNPQSFYSPKSFEVETAPPEEVYVSPAEEGQESPQYQYGEYSNSNSTEEYFPQEGYSEVEAEGYNSDTFIEIAEQVFSEKIKKEQNQIEALNEFATLAETKISNNHERIKRIEAVIDKLQIAILEKIGSYGKNLESIKDEMEMMQNSFEKIVPKLHEENAKHRKTSSN
jgi:hypothetical protein